MLVATHYAIEREDESGTYHIHNLDAPLCPSCGLLLSGYDTRARHVIDSSGAVWWFRLRRLRCLDCGKLHIELPDFMRARKHYEADVISDAIAGHVESCPADASTMRRWRVENHPPGLPSPCSNSALSWKGTE